MSQLKRTKTIDREILDSSDAILDEIVGRLGITLHDSPSGAGERPERDIDEEVAGLRGSLYPGLPTGQIPLEAFRVEELRDPAPLSRPRIDSFAPMAMGADSSYPPPARAALPSAAPEAERARSWRPAPWVLAYAVAAGVAGFVGTGALVRSREAVQVAGAHALAAASAAPAVVAQAPAHVAEPAPSPVAKAAVEGAPVPATKAAPAVAPRSAPRAASVAARAAAPVAAAEPAAAPAADLPLVLPPPPPKPQVAFDRAAAAMAVAGAARASSCRVADAGPMAVPVRVTFAPSGHATGAGVTGGPLLGTPAGACMAAALRGAHVPAFDGDPIAVSTTVHLR